MSFALCPYGEKKQETWNRAPKNNQLHLRWTAQLKLQSRFTRAIDFLARFNEKKMRILHKCMYMVHIFKPSSIQRKSMQPGDIERHTKRKQRNYFLLFFINLNSSLVCSTYYVLQYIVLSTMYGTLYNVHFTYSQPHKSRTCTFFSIPSHLDQSHLKSHCNPIHILIHTHLFQYIHI